MAAAVAIAMGALAAGCASPPDPSPTEPPAGPRTANLQLARCATAVIATDSPASLHITKVGAVTGIEADEPGSFASAAPVTSDGYFLTAEHAMFESKDAAVWLLYGNAGDVMVAPARVVWRLPAADLALLHAPIDTPHYFRWSPVGKPVAAHTPVFHGGLARGPEAVPGRVVKGFRPDLFWASHRPFHHTVPTTFGDSGGPVVDAQGRLLGINTMIKLISPLKTQFFAETTAVRPNVSRLETIIENDRRNQPADPHR